MFFIYLFLFFLAGFIQEILITTYHRAIDHRQASRAMGVSMLIAIISLLAIAEVTKKIFDPSFGWLSYCFVAVFAIGKGLATFLSVKFN